MNLIKNLILAASIAVATPVQAQEITVLEATQTIVVFCKHYSLDDRGLPRKPEEAKKIADRLSDEKKLEILPLCLIFNEGIKSGLDMQESFRKQGYK